MSADCENCALVLEQNDALQRKYVEEFEKREAVVNRLTKADQEIAGLKGQLTQLREDKPTKADEDEIGDFWKRTLDKRPNTVFGTKRRDKVRARLNEPASHPDLDRKADLKWAIMGCKAKPYSGNYARWSEPGAGRKRKDGLEVICLDEVSIERFMSYADEHAEAKFLSFLHALERVYGGEKMDCSFEDNEPFHVAVACPHCQVEYGLQAMPGSVVNCEWIWVECSSGCAPARVLEALRELDSKPRLVAAA